MQYLKEVYLLALCMAVAVVFCSADNAMADMSVNGFFPSDYVRTDVFDGSAAKTTSVNYEESGQIAARISASQSQASPKVMKIRSHSGRFAKTSKGTRRSSVQQSEWDVSPIITSK